MNLPEHADNPVHTDGGARDAGFGAALVAGTTVHAYLTHLPAKAWGTPWLDRGWSELRLLAPVLDQDAVNVDVGDSEVVEARVDGKVRATLAVALQSPNRPRASGERLPDWSVDLSEGLGSYGCRAGDDLDLYERVDRAHPSVWPCIANAVTKANCVEGPWVHVRSTITHLGPVSKSATVETTSTIVDRFASRAGVRVVIDIRAHVDGVLAAIVEHESIVRLADAPKQGTS